MAFEIPKILWNTGSNRLFQEVIIEIEVVCATFDDSSIITVKTEM